MECLQPIGFRGCQQTRPSSMSLMLLEVKKKVKSQPKYFPSLLLALSGFGFSGSLSV